MNDQFLKILMRCYILFSYQVFGIQGAFHTYRIHLNWDQSHLMCSVAPCGQRLLDWIASIGG